MVTVSQLHIHDLQWEQVRVGVVLGTQAAELVEIGRKVNLVVCVNEGKGTINAGLTAHTPPQQQGVSACLNPVLIPWLLTRACDRPPALVIFRLDGSKLGKGGEPGLLLRGVLCAGGPHHKARPLPEEGLGCQEATPTSRLGSQSQEEVLRSVTCAVIFLFAPA